MTHHAPRQARVIPLRPATAPGAGPGPEPAPQKEPLWRDVVGDVLRRERQAQERTLKDVADEARISMPYLSELERGRKEASSEVLAAAARALGLGLADLLALAQGEIVRRTASVTSMPSPGAARRATTSSYDGMCLAA
ncbi:helix-turn-helix domain-containing protein [Streptomyces cavernae]|uniref:helix-turn-helix domain-containing protein n=1 Tax=Streptomyces cavernae TaxID=2259034 RepID=UPI000FEBF30D|nr:helix-turn-helix transcriptional regulator [Streptomyces cavernae]